MLPAVAENVAVVEPWDTVTDAGTVTAELFDDNVGAVPPEPAALLSVTVHMDVEPEVKVVGLHARAATAATGVTVTVALALPPPPDAVITAEVGADTDPALAVNVPELAP